MLFCWYKKEALCADGRLVIIQRRVMGLPKVAYFSMEIALDQSLSTYSGGLGFLAGSHMLSAGILTTSYGRCNYVVVLRLLQPEN